MTRRSPSVVAPTKAPIRVSVVIPVKDDAVRLNECLEALSKQTFKEPFEILVIDNGSSDNPEEVVAKFKRAHLTSEPAGGSYAARNAGLKNARGEILAFTDSDCKPHPNWLEVGVKHLEAAGANAFVGGRIALYPKNTKRPTTAELYDLMQGFPQQHYVEKQHFAATANMIVWHKAFARIGPFQQTLISSGDREWGNRAQADGLKAHYANDLVVDHPCRATLSESRAKNLRLLRGDLQLRRVNGRKLVHLRELLVAACPPLPTLIRTVPKVQPPTARFKAAYVIGTLYITYARLFDRLRLLLSAR